MRQRLTTLSIAPAYALVLAAIVISVAGYYEASALLPMQVILIAVPTAVPFAVLMMGRPTWQLPGSIVLALLLALGWGYVAYVDSRPYSGGGASFAILLGWATCAALAASTLIMVLIDRARSAACDPRWRRRA